MRILIIEDNSSAADLLARELGLLEPAAQIAIAPYIADLTR